MGLKILTGHAHFRDRSEAGKLLAKELLDIAPRDPLVLGIPRGGISVGFPIAQQLNADLDLVAARKLRAPWNPELAIGAIMEGGETHLNRSIINSLRVTDEYLAEEKQRELTELAERTSKYRQARDFIPRKDRNLIVVDDGVATGATMIATLHGLRGAAPASLWCALPVAPRDTLDTLAEIADEVICLLCPSFFQAVGQFYLCFDQVSDAEVLALLEQSGRG